MTKIAVLSSMIFICFSCTAKSLINDSLIIKVDKNSISMGRSVKLTSHLSLKLGKSLKDYLLLPYVNQCRWGSQERPDSNGCIFLPCGPTVPAMETLLLSEQ